jgi:glutamine synthetase
LTPFAERCGAHGAPRTAACARVLERLRDDGIERVRIGWCDLHGVLRGKTLLPRAVPGALANGIGMVSTILLKDTSDRTAWKVFEPGATAALPGFGAANNLVLLPDPESFRLLPWSPGTAWLRAEAWFEDGTPVPFDTRRVLRGAVDALAADGFAMKAGLELEFHIWRLTHGVDGVGDASLDPQRAAWPGEPPQLTMLHPGHNLLAEGWSDMAEDALRIVERTAAGLDLPLTSLEIELGPSQVEAVFDVEDALDAADHAVLFRNGVRQALRRAGYHASFVCLPPLPSAMASGWHLHHSVVERATGANAFQPQDDANGPLSPHGRAWLAGLLAHGRAMQPFCAPTANAYARFRPNAMAPNAVVWGRDNRGAMLRVLGGADQPATRIENRSGEPTANPYLYLAAQIHAGRDGLRQGLDAPAATESPYASDGSEAERLPASLGEALDALEADAALVDAFGRDLVGWLVHVKRFELARLAQAPDAAAWQAREYFSRF